MVRLNVTTWESLFRIVLWDPTSPTMVPSARRDSQAWAFRTPMVLFLPNHHQAVLVVPVDGFYIYELPSNLFFEPL